ncbi:MAG: DUF5671 domain-containing protein [Patescibacteria group bacterium]|nr:DUF5671 domain-containing protein [Patescibacteria group bacterium]MDD4304473.1 DUF5671 domain-containing protein [Patescibacteria group bacterium]MDD4694833.1 DUF5671 domain-containing protein [Patescibacteria group bacterium]
MSSTNSAKITFFYLLSLFGLVFAAISSGMILFQVINKLIPDTINYSGRFSAEALSFAISSVIIAMPVYYWMTSLIQKSLKKGELDKNSQLRKWMTYIIIFVSAVVIIISLIVIINNYLNGDLTSKTALKVLTTIVISGVVLSYYLYNIKRIDFEKNIVSKVYFWGSMFLVITILISGFLVADSPAQVRKIKFDTNTVNDLNSIRNGIEEYTRNYGELPKNLESLSSDMLYYLRTETDINNYEYKILSDKEYEICAEFKTNSDDIKDTYINQKEWPHEIGKKCFERKVFLVDIKLKD